MSTSIKSVVYSITADTSDYQKNLDAIAKLEAKQAALTEKYDKKSVESNAKIAISEQKLIELKESLAKVSGSTAQADIAAAAQIQKNIDKESSSLEKLKNQRVIAEKVYQDAMTKTESKLVAARAKTEKMSKGITAFKASLLGVGAALGGLSIRSVVNAFDNIATELDAIAKRARDVGLTASQLQEFGHQASLSGLSVSQLDSSVKAFNKNISLAMGGTGEACAALNTMGISLKKANGETKTQAELLEETAYYFEKNAGAATNAGYASRIFGDNAGELIRIFESGQGSVESIFNAKGIDDAAASAERYKDQIEHIGNEFKKISYSLVGAILDSKDSLFARSQSQKDSIEQARLVYEEIDAIKAEMSEMDNIAKAENERIGRVQALKEALTEMFIEEKTNAQKKRELDSQISQTQTKIEERQNDARRKARAEIIEEYKKYTEAYYEKNKEYFDAFANLEAEYNSEILVYASTERKLGELETAALQTEEHYNDLIALVRLENDAKKIGLEISQKTEKTLASINSILTTQAKSVADIAAKTAAANLKEIEDKKKLEEANQKSLDAENARILALREDYAIKLRLQVLEKAGNTAELEKFKTQLRVLELMKKQNYTKEQALKFVKLENSLADGKKVEYSKGDIAKAQKMLEKGTSSKAALAQAQNIVDGEEIQGKRLNMFANVKSRRILPKDIDISSQLGDSFKGETLRNANFSKKASSQAESAKAQSSKPTTLSELSAIVSSMSEDIASMKVAVIEFPKILKSALNE